MVDFAPLIATAQRLISENGRGVTLLRFDSTPADPAQPWDGPTNPRTTPDETIDVEASFVPASGNWGLTSIVSDDLIKRSEQVCLISAGASVDLTGYQEMTDNGKSWKIVGVEVLQPATEYVLTAIGVTR